MPSFARIRPSKRFGLVDTPQEAWFAPTVTQIGTTIPWTIGAALSYGTVGTQASPSSGTVAGFLTEGGWAAAATPVSPATTIIGFAAEPLTETGSFTTSVGTESFAATGAGTAINGRRRHYYPVGSQIKFIGTLDTSGNIANTALALADVGSYFLLRPIDNTTAAAGSGAVTIPNTTIAATKVVWILDRTGAPTVGNQPNGNSIAFVTKLIDPPGAKTTDTPVTGFNSGQSLVEFMIVPVANVAVAGTAEVPRGPQL